MKKITLLFTLLSVAFVAYAQETKIIGDFTKVNVFDKIEVTLVPAKETKMEVSGSNINEVNFINKNGNLKIKMNLANSFQGENTKVILYYNDLEEVIAEEGAKIKSDKTLKAKRLSVVSRTGGKVTLDVKVDNLTVRAATGGEITLKGEATKQDIVSNAGAEVNNEKLVTKTTDVTVNAGGKAFVNVIDSVDAKTRAGGEISIYGNPKKINEKVVMGGNINIIK